MFNPNANAVGASAHMGAHADGVAVKLSNQETARHV